MTKIYDVSLTIKSDIVTWPGDSGVTLEKTSQIENGDVYNNSRMTLGVHTGTHVDAPRHFVADGQTVETLDLNVLTGPVQVVHLPDTITEITAELLAGLAISPGTERLFFRTRNSHYWDEAPTLFQMDFVAILPDAAEALVKMGIRLVGVDYLSVAPFHNTIPTHQILLQAGMILVEGLNLGAVSEGLYMLYCLPMKLGGSDGAPARVILVEE
jgi:arylformamidase